jgi:hypothetical protein
MPEPSEPAHLFGILQNRARKSSRPDGQKEDFNYVANWLKHCWGADQVEIEEWI